MGDSFAHLSDDAIARLGADAYLFTGDRDAAERLLRSAARHVVAAPRRGKDLEWQVRALLAARHRRRRPLNRRHAGTSAGPVGGPGDGTSVALAGLTPTQRAATVLHRVDGWDARDIAAALGMSERAVHAALGSGAEATTGTPPARTGRGRAARVEEVDVVPRGDEATP